MSLEDKSAVNTSVADPLVLEREKTNRLLTEFKAIAPKRFASQHYHYNSPTLLDKIGSYHPGQSAYLFITSLSSLLTGNESGHINVNLEKDNYGRDNLRIGWPAPLTLGVSIGSRDSAETRLDVRPFSYSPHPSNMAYVYQGDPLPVELIHQVYSNAVLGLVTEDLSENHVRWGEELCKKRDNNLKGMRDLVGEERSWVIDRSIKALSEVAGDQEFLVCVPDINQRGEALQKPVLYTTASITEELANKFSRLEGFGTYYPTEYRSANDPNSRPLMVVRYYRDLEVEIIGVKKPYNPDQDQSLRSSLYHFMNGDRNAVTFTIFPPHNHMGVETALVAANPQVPAFNAKQKLLVRPER
ncbi:MAG: hypothetical protein PHQ59_03850 [Candidatus Daviesbacteria bacterium]|nr:hypothetical protein [Candidatus Daviesbacteria bacterium]